MKARSLIYSGVLASILVLGAGVWFGVSRWRASAATERYRRLTTCQLPTCQAGAECAVLCARQFLDRNGYGIPSLAKRDELVFDVVESMHGGDANSVLAARANSLSQKPSQVCRLPAGGYSLFFTERSSKTGRGELLTGRVLLMNESFSDIHLLHEDVLMFRDGKTQTDSCTFLE